MTLQRYFVDAEYWKDNRIVIEGEDARHIVRVMRFRPGDKIICNQPDGKAAVAVISEIDDHKVIATREHWLDISAELPIKVTIAQGLPKGDKIELILQKGTELGACAFIPFEAERSIVKWDRKKREKKIQRYRKIVKEASEQSQRNMLPKVYEPMNIEELIKESKHYDMNIFAYEEEAKTDAFHSFGRALKQLNEGDRLFICIGPEGGFSEKEATLLKQNGFHPVRLGPRILRTETAPLYALSSISYHFEES